MTVIKMEGLAVDQPLKREHAVELQNGRPDLRRYGTIVPTAQLAPVLERLIALAADEAGTPEIGAAAFAQKISHKFRELQADSVLRRIFSIRNHEYLTTKADIAERMLEGAGTTLKDEGIIELPSSLRDARDRIDAYCDAKGRELPPNVKCDLADDLFEYVLLLIFGPAEEWQQDEAVAA